MRMDANSGLSLSSISGLVSGRIMAVPRLRQVLVRPPRGVWSANLGRRSRLRCDAARGVRGVCAGRRSRRRVGHVNDGGDAAVATAPSAVAADRDDRIGRHAGSAGGRLPPCARRWHRRPGGTGPPGRRCCDCGRDWVRHNPRGRTRVHADRPEATRVDVRRNARLARRRTSSVPALSLQAPSSRMANSKHVLRTQSCRGAGVQPGPGEDCADVANRILPLRNACRVKVG